MNNEQNFTYEYEYENEKAIYRVAVSYEIILREKYDMIYYDDVKKGVIEMIDTWEDTVSELSFSACCIEFTKERKKQNFSLKGYQISIQLMDIGIPVFFTPNTIILGYDTFVVNEKAKDANRVKRLKF